jgi:hypothetical protein
MRTGDLYQQSPRYTAKAQLQQVQEQQQVEEGSEKDTAARAPTVPT